MAATAALLESVYHFKSRQRTEEVLQYTQGQNTGHGGLELPVELNPPKHRNGEGGKENIRQDGDT